MIRAQPVTAGWKTVRLRDAFRQITRRNDRGVSRVLTASGQHGLIDQTEYFNRSIAGKSLENYFLLERGEFAYNRSLMQGYPFGAIKRLDRYPMGVVSTLYLCIALKNDLFWSDFVAQLFESGLLNTELAPIAKIGARAHGLLNVTPQEFLDIQVPLPPLPEQRKIAAILSSVDTAIEKTEALIAKLRDLKVAMMQELLTKGIGHTQFRDSPVGRIPVEWKMVRLGEIAKVCRGRFSPRPRNDPRYYGGRVPFVQTGDVTRSDGLLTTYSQTLNELGLRVSKLFPKGTILVTIAANIGDVAVTIFDVACPDSLVGVVPMKGIDVGWLAHYLISRKRALESEATQNAQSNINLQVLTPFPVPLPSQAEQKQIGSVFAHHSQSIRLQTDRLNHLQSLKKALMQDLLTGRVRVKV